MTNEERQLEEQKRERQKQEAQKLQDEQRKQDEQRGSDDRKMDDQRREDFQKLYDQEREARANIPDREPTDKMRFSANKLSKRDGLEPPDQHSFNDHRSWLNAHKDASNIQEKGYRDCERAVEQKAAQGDPGAERANLQFADDRAIEANPREVARAYEDINGNAIDSRDVSAILAVHECRKESDAYREKFPDRNEFQVSDLASVRKFEDWKIRQPDEYRELSKELPERPNTSNTISRDTYDGIVGFKTMAEPPTLSTAQAATGEVLNGYKDRELSGEQMKDTTVRLDDLRAPVIEHEVVEQDTSDNEFGDAPDNDEPEVDVPEELDQAQKAEIVEEQVLDAEAVEAIEPIEEVEQDWEAEMREARPSDMELGSDMDNRDWETEMRTARHKAEEQKAREREQKQRQQQANNERG